MKRTITRHVLLTLVLLTTAVFSSYAQTYYNLYLCDDATAKLRPQQESSLVAGDKVHWFLDGLAVGSPITYTGTTGSTDLNVPANLTVGLHKYTTAIESKDGCLGPQSDAFEVFKLPNKTLTLSAPTLSSYCEDASGSTTSSQIVATAAPASGLPDGVEYAYTWSATKDGSNVGVITTIGSSNGSTGTTNTFTLNATSAGTYVFTAKVDYALAAGNTGVLKAGAGCSVTSSTSQTIKVNPKPAKPSIMLVN